jgi:hypothetical protein
MKHPIFISAQFWNKHFMGFWFVKMLRRHVPTLDILHHFYILVFSTGPIGTKLGRNVHGDGYF